MLIYLKIRQNKKFLGKNITTNFELRKSRKTRQFQKSDCPKNIYNIRQQYEPDMNLKLLSSHILKSRIKTCMINFNTNVFYLLSNIFKYYHFNMYPI